MFLLLYQQNWITFFSFSYLTPLKSTTSPTNTFTKTYTSFQMPLFRTVSSWTTPSQGSIMPVRFAPPSQWWIRAGHAPPRTNRRRPSSDRHINACHCNVLEIQERRRRTDPTGDQPHRTVLRNREADRQRRTRTGLEDPRRLQEERWEGERCLGSAKGWVRLFLFGLGKLLMW